MNTPGREPSLMLSLVPLIAMFVILMVGRLYLDYRIEPLILSSAVIAGFAAWYLRCPWQPLEEAILAKIDVAMGGMFIIFSVGCMVGAWMFSGTVPFMVYWGMQLVNPHYMLLSAFLICTIVSVCTGTSWGSAATIGVAMIGIAQGLGIPLAPVAGAALSGCYVGDKLSPLSDTTNLAPAVAGATTYEHIGHMLHTTIPGTILCCVVFFFASSTVTGDLHTPAEVQDFMNQLTEIYDLNILLVIPPLLLIAGSILRWPILPTIVLTTFFSLALGCLIQGFDLRWGILSTTTGFKISMTDYLATPSTAVQGLLNRGGMMGVLENMGMLCVAMAFGGIMHGSGMLTVVLQRMLKRVRTDGGLIATTLISCVVLCFSTGSAYMGILIPGALFKESYLKRCLHPKNLSRALEDSATMLDGAIPWASGAVYMSGVLGVSAFEYVPWMVFNLSSVFIGLFCALLGIGIVKISPDDARRRLEEAKLDATLPEDGLRGVGNAA